MTAQGRNSHLASVMHRAKAAEAAEGADGASTQLINNSTDDVTDMLGSPAFATDPFVLDQDALESEPDVGLSDAEDAIPDNVSDAQSSVDSIGVSSEVESSPTLSAREIEQESEGSESTFKYETNTDWFPFPSATFFWLFLLCNMPEHPVSVEFQICIWFILEQLGVPNLPTIASIREFGKRKLPRLKIVECKSTDRHVFHIISPSDLVRQEVSKPEIQRKLTFYPVESNAVYKSFCQGEKWRTHPAFQSPMVVVRSEHYFVGDYVYIPMAILPSSLPKGEFRLFSLYPGSAYNSETHKYSVVRLERFYARGFDSTSDLMATVSSVILIPNTRGCILDLTTQFNIPISAILSVIDMKSPVLHDDGGTNTLCWNLIDVITRGGLRGLGDPKEISSLITSPLRAASAGRRVVNVPIVLGTDETSGNRTKKWNHHEQYFLKLAGLSSDELFKLHNVHVLCTSNLVSFAELGLAIVKDLNEGLSKGIVGIDYMSPEPRELLIVGSVLSAVADNPRASQLCSQDIACTAFCRCCTIRKGASLRPWDFFQRDPAVSLDILEQMRASSSAESDRLRKETGIVFGSSICEFMFKLNGFNPHEDIPIEILHTLLIGNHHDRVHASLSMLTSNI